MSEVLVRFGGLQELVIAKLQELGIFKTRSEAIRAGILQLGKEYNLFRNMSDIEDELAARKMEKISVEIKHGRRKIFTELQIKKKYNLK